MMLALHLLGIAVAFALFVAACVDLVHIEMGS